MNLNMIRPKNETQDLLISISKNCQTLIEQTHRKAEETLEFKMSRSKQTFHFKPPIQVKGDWMIGLVDLEVYISIFNITEKKINSNSINFRMKKLVVFHTQKSETRLKKTWIFQILQLPIYRTI